MICWGARVRTGEYDMAALCFAYEGWYYHIGGDYAIAAICGSCSDPWWLATRLKMLAELRVTHAEGI